MHRILPLLCGTSQARHRRSGILLAGARQRQIVRFVLDRHRAIELRSGVVLVVVAIWDLRENWDGIRFTLGL